MAEYYVDYVVEGFGERRAGPYLTRDEAEAQLLDISSYEGVSLARITVAPPRTIFDLLKEPND